MPDAKQISILSSPSAESALPAPTADIKPPCARDLTERPSEFGPQGAPNDPYALMKRLSERRVPNS